MANKRGPRSYNSKSKEARKRRAIRKRAIAAKRRQFTNDTNDKHDSYSQRWYG